MVAHELRGPLSGAMGLSELLVRSPADFDDATRTEMLADILGSVERVVAVLDDVLLAVHGPDRLSDETVDLAASLVRGLGAADPHLDALAAPLSDAPPVRGDAAAVARVLAELVANGRAPSAGRQQPALTWQAGAGEVAVDVADAGPAILPEEREVAVNRLDRAPGGLRSKRNPGLGVEVARVLAEAMGGGVSIDDGPDGGCVFRVRFPLA